MDAAMVSKCIVGFQTQFTDETIFDLCEQAIQYIIDLFSTTINHQDVEGKKLTPEEMMTINNDTDTAIDIASDDDDADDYMYQQFLLTQSHKKIVFI
jgi:hypothetical protein